MAISKELYRSWAGGNLERPLRATDETDFSHNHSDRLTAGGLRGRGLKIERLQQ